MDDLRLKYPAEQARGRLLRESARNWTGVNGISERVSEDAELILSELFSNAVRASDAEATVEISVTMQRNQLVIEVCNTGPGFDPATIRRPSADRPGGRGIAIISALGALDVEQIGTETRVRVTLSEAMAPAQ